ncbi:MAG: hypothetical protein D6729_09530 [Deltaproteobacteria bacterium]|nr:MAG: hypothetical protein D6729_09530 [Deltaproteobacteria bacterium]
MIVRVTPCFGLGLVLLLFVATLPTRPAWAGSPADEGADDDRAFLGEVEVAKAPPPTPAAFRTGEAQELIEIGRDLVDQGLPQAAIPFLKAAIEKEPERAEAHYQLGRAYEALGRQEPARQAYARYLSLVPEQEKQAARKKVARPAGGDS